MKTNTAVALIFSIAIVLSTYLLSTAYIERGSSSGTVSVKGLGKIDFVSDLIVWSGEFSAQNTDLKTAYTELEKERKIIADYFKSKGINQDAIFSAVSTEKIYKDVYTENGKYAGQEFTGYKLKQSVTITSKKVNLVENISREITELLNQGVEFYSDAPRYYYTKLEDLKLKLIEAATKNARERAEKIVEQAGADLGDLVSAKMGVFQITGQYSDEDYSWGGTFNTSSKEKTASITVRLIYTVE